MYALILYYSDRNVAIFVLFNVKSLYYKYKTFTFVAYLKHKCMTKEILDFLSRLKSIKDKAFEERVVTKTIYDRIAKGMYETIEIGGMKFIVEPKKE